MSTLGATGWAKIGSNFGTVLLWAIVLSIIGLLIVWLHFVLFVMGIAVAVQNVLEMIEIILAVIVLILFCGDFIYLAWNWLSDLGHNFYAVWKTSGIGAAWTRFKADVTTCSRAFVSGVKKAVSPVVNLLGALKKKFWP